MVRFDKRAGVVGAVTGAVSGALAGSTDFTILETLAIVCLAGAVVGIIIHFVWR